VAESYGPVVSPATDQLLPPGVPGFRDADIYPLGGANLAKARKLANGRLRTGKAVFAFNFNFAPLLETAQLVKEQLAKIGLEVEFKHVPQQITLTYLTSPGADWDIAFVLWTPNIPDAHAYLNLLMETQLQGGETLTRVRSRLASAALARAARLPQGRARNLAYAEVDAMITRDVAPVAVLSVLNEATLVTERVGCLVLRPALDLAVACLRE
jgi:ABC-type transport system substrate-binding protein